MSGGAVAAKESGSALVYDHGEFMGWEHGGQGHWGGLGTRTGTTRWNGEGGLAYCSFGYVYLDFGTSVFVPAREYLY